MVRFVEKQINEPTWVIKKPDFGKFIPNLHLEMLEIKSKVKPNAPLIPDSTYQGNAFTEPEPEVPLPDGGAMPDKVEPKITFVVEDELESHSHVHGKHDDGTHSSDDNDFTQDDLDIMDRFGATPEHKHEEEDEPEAYVIQEDDDVPAHEHTYEEPQEESPVEEDEEDRYAREIVEKRNLLKFMNKHNIAFEETDSLKILRELKNSYEEDELKEKKKEQSLGVNKFLLGCCMWGASEGMERYDEELKGFLQYQMKLMPMYDGVLEEFDEIEIAELIMDLPPVAKLGLLTVCSSGAFVAMKKFGWEEKLRNSRFLETVVPGYGKFIDQTTKASEEVKRENGEPESKRRRPRRGPSLSKDEIKKML